MANFHASQYSSSYTYDLNGNIKTLTRNGMTASGMGQIDDLDYTYDNEGRLTDLEELSDKEFGFKSTVANGMGDYTYDENGNMLTDAHKGITVTYNHLNLPTKIVKPEGEIEWIYDATGAKLSKTVTTNHLEVNINPIFNKEYKASMTITSNGTVPNSGDVTFTAGECITLKEGFTVDAGSDFLARIMPNNVVQVRDYLGGIEYFESELEAVYFAEGRVKFNGSSSEREFYLSDYQGNTRVLFIEGAGVAQVAEDYSFYPFGALHQEQSSYNQKYLFGGKELQTELDLGWSDFGTRCLDNWSGKWLGVDIMSEVTPQSSPYAYTLGNPIRFSDPTGMLTEDEDGMISTSNSLWGRDATGGENSGEVGRTVRKDTQDRKPDNSNNKNGNWTANIDGKGNISYSAGEGDNFTTFAKQFGVESAWDIFTKEENEATFNNIYPKNARWGKKKFSKGEMLKTDRVYPLILSGNTSIQSIYNQQEFMSNYLYFYGLETFNLDIFFDVRSVLGISNFDGIATSKDGNQFQFTAEFGLTGRRILNSPPQSNAVGLKPFFGNYKFYSPEDKNWGPRVIFSRKNGYLDYWERDFSKNSYNRP